MELCYKEIIELLEKLNQNEDISEIEQEKVNNLYENNIILNDDIKYNKLKNINFLNDVDFTDSLYCIWTDFAKLMMGSGEPNENTTKVIEMLKQQYSYDKKVDQIKIEEINKFYIKRGDWTDEVGDVEVRNTYLLMHKDYGYIDTLKAILIDENKKDDLINNIKFSIGWKPEYYEKIGELLDDKLFKSLMEKMNDVSCINSKDYDELYRDNKALFDKSILRYSSTKYKLNEVFQGITPSKKLSLKTETECNLEIEFNHHENFNNRFIVLIGENGVGKSKLLKEIYTDNIEFESETKVVAEQINCKKQLYFSFGLFDDVSSVAKKESYHIKSFLNEFEFYNLLDKGLLRYSKDRQKELSTYIEMFFENESIRLTDFQEKLENFFLGSVSYNDLFIEFKKLSTGEKYITYFLICIISNISTDSVIYIDEPENSQHPQYVMKIMKVLDSILKKYGSRAIIATHSHIILQGIPKYAVVHMYLDEFGNNQMQKLEVETFGRNFNALMYQIYNIQPNDYLYIQKIDEVLEEDKDRDLSFLYNGTDFDGSILESYIFRKKGDLDE